MAETRWVGQSLKRKEDPPLLTGRGSYIDDLKLSGMLHAAVLHSSHAHARIVSIDASEALKLPGVLKVMTGREVARRILPFMSAIGGPFMEFGIAVDRTRYAGEPVALIVATDRYTAEDARELIRVEYEPLPAVVDLEEAVAPGAPLLYEMSPSNALWQKTVTWGDPEGAFRQAAVLVREKFYFHRYSSTPVETCGVVTSYDPTRGSLTIYDNNHLMNASPWVSMVLKLPPEKVRFIRGDIGGSYGNKTQLHVYEVLIGVLSMELGRPVKWIADRSDDLMDSCTRCANVVTEVEFALKGDGTILGMRTKAMQDMGSFIRYPEPVNIIRQFYCYTSSYKIRHVLIDVAAVVTNKAPTGPNRGYGLHNHFFVLERMMDRAAKELGMDPAEIRFRNFVQPQEMPYTTVNDCVYDGGDYPETLHRALEMIGYQQLRQEQAKLRQEGKYLGIGIATITEPGTPNSGGIAVLTPPERRIKPPTLGSDGATVRLGDSGKATVLISTMPEGQGHQTVTAQIVADELGLTPDDVTVLSAFDSATHPHNESTGTYGSRYASAAVGAILTASRQVRAKLVALAAHLLEAKPEEVVLENGMAFVRTAPEKAISVDKITAAAYNRRMPEGVDTTLEASNIYHVPFFEEPTEDWRGRMSATYGNSAHIAVVEVDPDTGEVKVKRYALVHDCGKMLNPLIVDGQIHGGIAHGLGGALYEEQVYDEKGQYLTGTFYDYLPPYATEVPDMEVQHMETPSLFNPLGAKGMGEGCSMPVLGLIANAVEDALAPFQVKIDRVPLTPKRVWELVRQAKGGG